LNTVEIIEAVLPVVACLPPNFDFLYRNLDDGAFSEFAVVKKFEKFRSSKIQKFFVVPTCLLFILVPEAGGPFGAKNLDDKPRNLDDKPFRGC